MTESTTSSTSARELAAHSLRLATGVIVVALPIFGTAGTFRYWNGWLFMAALFIPMTIALVYLHQKHRALLEKRLKVREKEREQQTYVKLSLLWFFISFAVPGLDYRFGWSSVPVWLVVISLFVMVGGYVLFMVAMVQNSFASRVIELQANQRVIDTGLYSIVRHPMYMAASFMFTACPLVLGSFYALIPSMLLPVLLAYRIRNEERILLTGLAGYGEYTQRVKYKMIPYVW